MASMFSWIWHVNCPIGCAVRQSSLGSLTLYAGAQSPGADKESNWLPAPDGPFSLYVRAYWGKEAILDGSWTPPVVKKVR